MELLLISLLIIALFTAAIARSKGRDFFGWLILGGLFPILGLIAVAAMPNLKSEIHPRNAKVCPRCAETVQKAALVCRHCGQPFDLETERANERSADNRRLLIIAAIILAVVVLGWINSPST